MKPTFIQCSCVLTEPVPLSGAMEEDIYVNVEQCKHFDSTPLRTERVTGRGDSEKRHRRVIFLLGLFCAFLSCWLIGLGAYHSLSVWRSAADLSNMKAQLTTEKDLLNASLIQWIQKQNRRECPAGWRMFRCSCYFLSNESSSWEESRKDCRSRGAHLVVVDRAKEQTFLSGIIETQTMFWIGLTDSVKEGTWTWVSGSPLNLKFWCALQPDNGNGYQIFGEEDCAHITTGTNAYNWNDLSCNTSLRWICEKAV